jgi:hypothetical protein
MKRHPTSILRDIHMLEDEFDGRPVTRRRNETIKARSKELRPTRTYDALYRSGAVHFCLRDPGTVCGASAERYADATPENGNVVTNNG